MVNASVLLSSWQTEPAASCWNAWLSATAPLEKLVCWWAMPTTPFQRNMCPLFLIIMQVNIPTCYCDIINMNQYFSVYLIYSLNVGLYVYLVVQYLKVTCVAIMETTCGLRMQVVHICILVARFIGFPWSEINKWKNKKNSLLHLEENKTKVRLSLDEKLININLLPSFTWTEINKTEYFLFLLIINKL